MKKTALLLGLGLMTSACATKNYGRVQQLSEAEATQYTCREIDLEMAKVEAFRADMAKTANFDWKSAAALLGDAGIGNAIEKNEAEKSANARMRQLMELRLKKNCANSSPTVSEGETPAAAS